MLLPDFLLTGRVHTWTFALRRGSALLQPENQVLSLFSLVERERRRAGGMSEEQRPCFCLNSPP